ncbi:aromatic acid exporter family protein [Streptomyces sp. NPDC056831]|uniref:FUSC family protein n=1 Tax=Streptomyces sp. NPDC056831 TaxID=3345954 RepID=UPI0036B2BAE6
MHGAKNLIAALLAWEFATLWIPGERPYVAVATALLMVNAATVYRSVTQAARSMATRAAGVLLALGTVWLLGSTAGSIAGIVGIALVAAGSRASDDRLQVASTAVLTLTAAAAAPVGHVVLTAIAALSGAVVGVAVNALIMPPIHLDESDDAVRGLARVMGALLRDMGHGLRERQHVARAHGWVEDGRGLGRRVADARERVQQGQESLRWNTCWAVHPQRRPVTYGDMLSTLHGVSLQVRGIARTLADNVDDTHTDHHLGQQFLDRYAEMLKLAGHAVEAFVEVDSASRPAEAREGLRAAIDRARAWHDTMTDLIGRGALVKPGAWHVYGSLMTDVERLLVDLDHAGRL